MISAAVVTKMRREGVPNYRIAEFLETTPTAVSNMAKRLGLPPYARGRSIERFGCKKKDDSATIEPETRSDAVFEFVETAFSPPAWSPKLDRQLFSDCTVMLEKTGSFYAAIRDYAKTHGLTILAVTQRWHLIARRT